MECWKGMWTCWSPDVKLPEEEESVVHWNRDVVFHKHCHLMNDRQELVHLNTWMTSNEDKHRRELGQLLHTIQCHEHVLHQQKLQLQQLSESIRELRMDDDLIIVTTDMTS